MQSTPKLIVKLIKSKFKLFYLENILLKIAKFKKYQIKKFFKKTQNFYIKSTLKSKVNKNDINSINRIDQEKIWEKIENSKIFKKWFKLIPEFTKTQYWITSDEDIPFAYFVLMDDNLSEDQSKLLEALLFSELELKLEKHLAS